MPKIQFCRIYRINSQLLAIDHPTFVKLLTVAYQNTPNLSKNNIILPCLLQGIDSLKNQNLSDKRVTYASSSNAANTSSW